MTNTTSLPGGAMPDDDDDDDFYDVDDSSLVSDEKWEDMMAVMGVQKKHPGLILMKVTGYDPKRFREIEAWCREFCTGKWELINWRGNCSYTVIVGFKKSTDALYYKMRWL